MKDVLAWKKRRIAVWNCSNKIAHFIFPHWAVVFGVLANWAFAFYLLNNAQDPAWVGHIQVDIWGWIEFFTKSIAGQIPFVDFTKEYPTGAGLFYWILAMIIDSNNHIRIYEANIVSMTLIHVVNIRLFYELLNKFPLSSSLNTSYLLFFAVCPTVLILNPVRFEALAVMFVLLGLISASKGSSNWAVFFWAVGAAVKWYPVVLIGCFMLQQVFSRFCLRSALAKLAILVGVLAAFNLPFALADYYVHGHFEHWFGPYAFHKNRPLYWDTILGVWGLWFGYPTAERYFSLVSLILVLLTFLYRPRADYLMKSAAILMVAFVVNRVYSTQFNLWFYPLILIFSAALPSPAPAVVLLLLLLLDCINIAVYPFSFTLVVSELGGFDYLAAKFPQHHWTLVFSILIMVRSFLLVFLIAYLFKWERKKPLQTCLLGEAGADLRQTA